MKRWARGGVLLAGVCCGLAGSPERAAAQDWLSPVTHPIRELPLRAGAGAQSQTPASSRATSTAAITSPRAPAPTAPATEPAPKKQEELVRWDVLGHSFENRAIEFARFGSGARRVLVVGALRGDEPEGVALAQALGEHLIRFPQRLDDLTVTIVRDPNPDGRARRSSANARGVELDRNFRSSGWRMATDNSSPGQQPESEPETRVLADLMVDVKPDRVIILGTSRPGAAVVYSGPAEYLAAQVAIEVGGQASRAEPNAIAGSMMTMTGVDRGIPTLWIGAVPQASGDRIWSENRRGLMTAIGCGTPVEFMPVASTPTAQPTTSQAPPNPRGGPSASPGRRSSMVSTAESRPANAASGVPGAAVAPQFSGQSPFAGAPANVPGQPYAAAMPAEAPQPLYYNQLRFGRPAVGVISPRSQRVQQGLPAVEQQPTVAPNVAPRDPTSPIATFEPPFNPRIQRLPPAQLFATPRRPSSPTANMPQQPIPIYPHTGY